MCFFYEHIFLILEKEEGKRNKVGIRKVKELQEEKFNTYPFTNAL